MTHQFHYCKLWALTLSASITLSACSIPEGQTSTQELITASTRLSASNERWLIVGTQAQGAVAIRGEPFEPRFHWRLNKDFPTPITGVAIATNAPKAITASNDRLVIWSSETGQAEHHLSAPAPINAVAINTEGTLAVLALTNNTAVIINLAQGGVVNTFVHQSPVLSVALSGQYLLTGEEANRAHLWLINSDTPTHTFEHNDAINYVAFGPSNTLVTAGRYDATRFWHKESGKEKAVIASKTKAMDAGRRAIGVIFENQNKVVIGYSDATIERVELTTTKTLKKWTVTPATPFTKSGASLVGLEQVNGLIYAITSDSRAHQLMD